MARSRRPAKARIRFTKSPCARELRTALEQRAAYMALARDYAAGRYGPNAGYWVATSVEKARRVNATVRYWHQAAKDERRALGAAKKALGARVRA